MNIERFLSDEFVEFSNKIKELQTKIKQEDSEASTYIKAYKERKAKLEQEAKSIVEEWDSKKVAKGDK